MKILGLVAENFKKIRVIEINPQGNLVQITGKNGQGKTSVLDSLWFALLGPKANLEKIVRKGAEKCTVKLDLGELIVTRNESANSATPTLKVQPAKGTTAWDTPQAMLDSLLGELTFDPLEFIHLTPKEQVEMLRKMSKLDLDVEGINTANKKDYDERTILNREEKAHCAHRCEAAR